MSLRVVVWGTGNVGRPALRAVLAHPELELAGVVVSSPSKVGADAGALCGVDPVGVAASDDRAVALAEGIDAVVYCATADTRPLEAMEDVLSCLRAGRNVLSTSLYGLLHPASVPPPFARDVAAACQAGGTSIFVSGIDPGWALDVLPLLLSGVVADLAEIRCQEIFDYRHYDQPEIVRKVIGFGGSLDTLPPMLHELALRSVWEPMVRILAEGLGARLDAVETEVERRPLEHAVDVPGMGRFEAGTQGAFRFEVRGRVGDTARIVMEHVTRIDPDCAPDWPTPHGGEGEHRVLLRGSPNLEVRLHASDPLETGPAAGGNATAANRIVNAIPAVCAARPGVLSPLDLPPMRGPIAWR